MIDINNTLDLIKLKFYNEWLYTAHIYDEGDSQFHQQLTEKVVTDYVDPINIKKDAVILDMGSGPGYFLDAMKDRGYTNVTGISLSPGDIKLCRDKGHTIREYDFSFLPQKDGFYDESVDFIFCRHALEHSPYPIFTLMEYNRLLKQGSKLYIEVPAPDCERKHEYNLNHYSILGATQLGALLDRTGFKIDSFNTMEFSLNAGTDEEGNAVAVPEIYYTIVATKQRPLDIK